MIFYLDGKKIGRLTRPNRNGRFSKRIDPRRLKRGRHVVHTRIFFRRSSRTNNTTQRVVFNVCSKKKRQPRFTG